VQQARRRRPQRSAPLGPRLGRGHRLLLLRRRRLLRLLRLLLLLRLLRLLRRWRLRLLLLLCPAQCDASRSSS
jgi:hypothetical protein